MILVHVLRRGSFLGHTNPAVRGQGSRAATISLPKMLILFRDPSLVLHNLEYVRPEWEFRGILKIGADSFADTITT
jgi:hypothetical protein